MNFTDLNSMTMPVMFYYPTFMVCRVNGMKFIKEENYEEGAIKKQPGCSLIKVDRVYKSFRRTRFMKICQDERKITGCRISTRD